MPHGKRAYLDYNATAPLRPEARAAMLAALGEVGNASSVHAEGRAARARVEAARSAVAALVGGDPKLVTFTSGGTEANNTVLTPDWRDGRRGREAAVLLCGATEHPSVLAGGGFMDDEISTIPVNGAGIVDGDVLRRLLAEAHGSALVSVMLANNETGAIQPVGEIAEIAHRVEAIVHSDVTQAAGRIDVNINDLKADVITLSAHKIGGPQGVGAIVRAREDLTFSPLLTGGGQERRLRAGTENVAAIAGFGAAAEAALADLGRAAEWAGWRDRLAGIVGPQATVFSVDAPRLPQTLCFAVPKIPAETLVIALDLAGVAVSSGSACSSGKVAPSHVLAAMGVAPDLAGCAIRLSLGWESAETDLDSFASAWKAVLKHVAPGEIQAA